MIDLDVGSPWREVQYEAFEVPGWRLQLSSPEGPPARVSPALLRDLILIGTAAFPRLGLIDDLCCAGLPEI
jgi:hypothetical protein